MIIFIDFQRVLTRGIERCMEESCFKEDLTVLVPLLSHAHNSPKEIEHKLLEKICKNINSYMAPYFSKETLLYLLPSTYDQHQCSLCCSFLLGEEEGVVVGSLVLSILLEDGALYALFFLNTSFGEATSFRYSLEECLPFLCAPANDNLLPLLSSQENAFVFID